MTARSAALRTALVIALSLAGCARAVEVSSGPAPTYPITVRNSVGEDAIVAYDDGSGARTLGTVQAGRTERFIIAAPRAMAISISARSTSGTRTWGPFALELAAGETRSVTIR